MKKRILSTLLAVIMLFSVITIVPFTASAANFNDINQGGVFVKQQTNYTCTLASAVMMVRRAAMMTGNGNWAAITESSMRPTAWNEGSGLWYNFTYAEITKPTEAEKPIETTVSTDPTDTTSTDPTTVPTTNPSTEPTESVTSTDPVTTECPHTNCKTIGKKSATYFAKGYTGDTVCYDCNKLISTGKATAKKTLKAPTGLKATAGKKKITVSYKKVSGAKGYKISYKLGKTSTTVTTTKLKYIIKDLKSKKTYTITVKAYVKSGKKTAYSAATKAKKVKVK